ncbi:MAG: hypothetical protein AB7I19_13625 [Planctomycetota bacterium]
MKTAKELAAALGVDRSRVYQMRREGLPEEEGGGWNLRKVQAWRADRKRRSLPAVLSLDRKLSRIDQLPGEQDGLESVAIDDPDSAVRGGLRPLAVSLARIRYWQAEEQKLRTLNLASRLASRCLGEARRQRMLAGLRALILELVQRVSAVVAEVDEPLAVQRILERAVEQMLAGIQLAGGVPLVRDGE